MSPKHYRNLDVGLLLLRVGVGLVFVAHGVAKFQNMDGTIAFFNGIGFTSFWAYLVASVELFGGLAMLIGIFTEIAGVLLAMVMLVAILKLKFAQGFLGGYEFDALLLLASFAMVLTGPGKYAMPCCLGKCELGMKKK